MDRLDFVGEREKIVDSLWQDAFKKVSQDMAQKFNAKGNLDGTTADDWKRKLSSHETTDGQNISAAITKATNEIKRTCAFAMICAR